MPCFKREKSLEYRSRRDTTNDGDPMAPKPVRPRRIGYHGLFGMSVAAQHLIVDEKWTPNSLTDQFTKMNDLLKRRVIFKQHEKKNRHAHLLLESRKLKTQCADGRLKLQKISSLNNAHTIHNYLSKHRDMQRLYQKMPLYLVADNINQRTFVMRKERDRLEFRLSQLKYKYKQLLLDRAEVQNRIKYETDLPEEEKCRILLKKIANSDVRQKAIRTINISYKKMLQVLLQDEIFYEPILRSLESDMEEQANFIKHILYLGIPVISKFKEISNEFNMLAEESRKNNLEKLQIFESLKKPMVTGPPEIKVKEILTADRNRYVRDTDSMDALHKELMRIEATIKDLKLTVLCSQAKEIYPNIKNQLENNELLHRAIETDRLGHESLRSKIKYASLLHDVLVNNLSEEEINRLQRISELKETLTEDEQFEVDTVDHLKNLSDLYVMMRFSLWNLFGILKNVDINPKATPVGYPNTYLKLPLLKFELLHMFSVAPDLFEENIDKIMSVLKRKIYILMKSFTPEMNDSIKKSTQVYHDKFMSSIVEHRESDEDNAPPIDDGLLQDRMMASIPNRSQIKAQSARIVEEAAKVAE